MSRYEPNPIFLREIRMAVRNNTILGCFCVNLALLCYITSDFLLQGNLSGHELSARILQIEYLFCIVTLPVLTASSTIRDSLCDDLLWTVPLSTRQRLAGKMQAVAVLIGLFYTTTLPFLAAAYLLRGVDILAVVVVVSVMMLGVFIASYWAAAFLYRLQSWEQLWHLLLAVAISFCFGGFLCFLPLLFPLIPYREGAPWEFLLLSFLWVPVFAFAVALARLGDELRQSTTYRWRNYLFLSLGFTVVTLLLFGLL